MGKFMRAATNVVPRSIHQLRKSRCPGTDDHCLGGLHLTRARSRLLQNGPIRDPPYFSQPSLCTDWPDQVELRSPRSKRS